MPYLDERGLSYLMSKLKEDSSGSAITSYPGIRVVHLKTGEWLTDHTQTEIVFGVVDNQKIQTVIVEPSFSQNDIFKASGITIDSRGENQITFHAENIPTQDLILYVTIFDLSPDQEEVLLDRIEVINQPNKTRYLKGTNFDPTGLKIKAYFANGLSFDIGLESLTFNPNTNIPLETTEIMVGFNWGGIEKTASIPITVIQAYVYGIQWGGGTNPKAIRTDDAVGLADPVPYASDVYKNESFIGSPFDDIYPWSGMEIVDRPKGKFVKIPKFYYKLSAYNSSSYTGVKIQISSEKLEGYHVSPLHMAREIDVDSKLPKSLVEIPYAYVSQGFLMTDGTICQGSVPDADHTPTYDQMIELTESDEAIQTHTFQFDMTAMFTIQLLYLVEYANFSAVEAIGRGIGANAASRVAPYTDIVSMPYHTGRQLIFEYADTDSQYDYLDSWAVSYRGINNLWGLFNYVGGVRVSAAKAKYDESRKIWVSIVDLYIDCEPLVQKIKDSGHIRFEAYQTSNQFTSTKKYWRIETTSISIFEPSGTEVSAFQMFYPSGTSEMVTSTVYDYNYSYGIARYFDTSGSGWSGGTRQTLAFGLTDAYDGHSIYNIYANMYGMDNIMSLCAMYAAFTANDRKEYLLYRLMELPQPDDEQEVNQDGSD